MRNSFSFYVHRIQSRSHGIISSKEVFGNKWHLLTVGDDNSHTHVRRKMAPSLVILCKTEINSFFSTILCSSEFASMSCFNCKNYFCQGKLDWIAHFLSPLDLRGEKRRGRDVFEAEQWKEERAGPS